MGHRDNEEERRKPLENAIPFLTPTIFDVVRVPDTRSETRATIVHAGNNEGGKIILLVGEMDDNYR